MDAVVCTHWMEGGKGAVALAEAVIKAAKNPANFQFLYPLEHVDQGKDRDDLQARSTARMAWITLPEAEAKIELFTKLGFDNLPLCMAKTHLSFSTIQPLKGAPKRLPRPDPRHPRLGWRRLPLSAAWRDAHHARPADTPRVL